MVQGRWGDGFSVVAVGGRAVLDAWAVAAGRGRGRRPATPDTVRRGQGYTLRVTAVPSMQRSFLARCQPLDAGHGFPTTFAERKARHEYENRVTALRAPV